MCRQCLMKFFFLSSLQQAQTTRVRPTAIRPTPPTVTPGGSPTPAYWVSEDTLLFVYSAKHILFYFGSKTMTSTIKDTLFNCWKGFFIRFTSTSWLQFNLTAAGSDLSHIILFIYVSFLLIWQINHVKMTDFSKNAHFYPYSQGM